MQQDIYHKVLKHLWSVCRSPQICIIAVFSLGTGQSESKVRLSKCAGVSVDWGGGDKIVKVLMESAKFVKANRSLTFTSLTSLFKTLK